MKKTNILWPLTCVCIFLVTFIGCGKKSGQKEYDKALDAWKSGDLVLARTLLERSIRKTSHNEQKSLAFNNLGLVLWQLDETANAADAFNQSCELSDALTDANLNLGIALVHANRIPEAEVALNNVMGDNPRNKTASALLGMLEMQKKNWSGAAKALSQTVKNDPGNPATQNALALAEINANKDSAAASTRLKRLLAAYPDYAPAAFNLAVIAEKWQGDKTSSIGWYRQYLAKAGSEGARVDEARRAIERLAGGSTASSINTQSTARFMAEGARLHGEKKYNEAVAQYRKAVEADPQMKSAHYNMGLAYYAQGKYAAAARAYENALTIDPRLADARYMLALSYCQLKAWKDAENAAKALEQIDSKRGAEMLKYVSESRK